MKAIQYLTAAAVCIIVLTGCREQVPTKEESPPSAETVTNETDNNQSVEEETVVLTNRQIEILTQLGLPTSYSALTDREKNGIGSIEKALVYLEDKYKESFTYLGYVDGSGMESEHMTAYPDSGSMDDVVTVFISYKNSSYSFTDDYVNILTRPVYKEAMEKFYSSYLPEGIIYTDIREVKDDKLPAEDQVLLNTSAVTTLIFDEEKADAEKVDTFLKAYSSYMEEGSTGLPSALDVYLMKSEAIEGIYFSDFENSMLQADYSYLAACSISSDGEARVKSHRPA